MMEAVPVVGGHAVTAMEMEMDDGGPDAGEGGAPCDPEP